MSDERDLKQEPKENVQPTDELSDKDLESVSGGTDPTQGSKSTQKQGAETASFSELQGITTEVRPVEFME
jgi:bacteriocin-like protein